MIQWTLVHMMGRYQAKTGERLSIRGLAAGAGVSPSAVCMMASGQNKRVDLRTLDKLLDFFEDVLEEPVSVADLMEYESSRTFG